MHLPLKVGDPNGATRPPWVCVPVDRGWKAAQQPRGCDSVPGRGCSSRLSAGVLGPRDGVVSAPLSPRVTFDNAVLSFHSFVILSSPHRPRMKEPGRLSMQQSPQSWKEWAAATFTTRKKPSRSRSRMTSSCNDSCGPEVAQ